MTHEGKIPFTGMLRYVGTCQKSISSPKNVGFVGDAFIENSRIM